MVGDVNGTPAAGATALRIALAPDSPVVLAGAAALITGSAPEMEIVVLEKVTDVPHRVDVLLYDPQKQPLTDLSLHRQGGSRLVVLGYSWSTRTDVVEDARRHGASGFVSKDLTGEELAGAIRAFSSGPRPERFLVRPQTGNGSRKRPPSRLGLTDRELEVLEMITQGFSNEEIASRLYLSINSVKTYVRTAYRKIGATRRTQAVLWGVQHGLSTTDPEPSPLR